MGKVRYYLIIFLIMFFPFHGKSQKNIDVVRFCECQKVGTIIPPRVAHRLPDPRLRRR